MKVVAVDLFCGAGGLSHGFFKEGINVKAGIDMDAACKYPYERNNDAIFIKADVSEISGRKLKRFFDDADYTVLAGCAPCQPFSLYTQGIDNKDSTQWGLLGEFLRLTKELRPDIVTMENVPQLKKHAIYGKFSKGLEAEGYKVTSFEIDCEHIGIPQTRRRLVLFASRYGKVSFVRPRNTTQKTVREAIGSLPAIKAGEMCSTDPFHKSSQLSELNLKRIKASKPGQSWKTWPKRLVAKCHQKEKGKTYPSVYGRMEWDKPAPTITTQFYGFGNGRFGHPKQNRAISPREAAILQTFPRNYKFIEPGKEVEMKSVGRMVGNAVPVKLGRLIAKSILRHLEQKHGG